MMADPDSFDEQERAAVALQGSATASGAEGLGSDPVFDSVIAHPGWITHIKDFVAQERTVFTNGGGIVLRWPGEQGLPPAPRARSPCRDRVSPPVPSTGQASGMHGGGEERHVGHKAGNHTWHDPLEYDDEGHYVSGYEDGGAGRFDGQLVSVLLALNDSPMGGGNTALVPGSESHLHSSDGLVTHGLKRCGAHKATKAIFAIPT